MSTHLTLNGKPQALRSDPGTPLLYVLRNELRLNGAKFGCGMGQCGACTVIVDGKPVFSCSPRSPPSQGAACAPWKAWAARTRQADCRPPSSATRRRNAGTALPAC